jgi:hypothetical protein
LSTSTEKINWGDEFDESFITNMNYIYFNELETKISINWKDVYFDDDDNAYITKFNFQTAGRKLVEYETPGESHDRLKLFLNDAVLSNKDDEEELTISSKNFPDDTPIFSFLAKNNELSKSLQQILDLIESSEHLQITEIDPFVNKFADLLIENGLGNINSVHVETISSVLFRGEDGERLDFTKEKLDPYKIIRVSKSILDGPLATSFAFERLNDQFINLKTYEKTEGAFTDFLFK